jgi:glycosyltransferase involved in cell wall biosynthesis
MRYSPLVERQKESRSQQVRAFDGVIVPAQYLKQMVMGWGVPDEKIHVIYNALPAEPAPDTFVSRDDLRAQWGWTTPTVLTAARLHPWKGVDMLIAALHEMPDIRLIVAGDGDDLPRLQALAAPLGEKVTFFGQVPRVTLYQMMQAADYFALYSGYEGLPHTVLESLRAGTPVIVSDKGGNPEIVQHGVNGYVVPYRDQTALVNTLQKAFVPGQRDRLAAHTHDQLSQFEFSTLIERTDHVLREFLATIR